MLLQDTPLKLDLSVEPAFIGLGPFHIAVGMNDRVWIHEIGEAGMYMSDSLVGTTNSAVYLFRRII